MVYICHSTQAAPLRFQQNSEITKVSPKDKKDRKI